MGIKDYENFQTEIEQGKNIIVKFKDNFFIAKLMEEQSESNKVTNFFGTQPEEEAKVPEKPKYDENSD